MIVIISSPNMTHKKVGDSEVFCFDSDRLRIAFKGEQHVSVTEKGTGMVVNLADASAITKLLIYRAIHFSTEHVSSWKGAEYTSPQIQLITEFTTGTDTKAVTYFSLEQEVDILINVIDKYHNVHELINHINNLGYRQRMPQPQQFFSPPPHTCSQHQPQGYSHYPGQDA